MARLTACSAFALVLLSHVLAVIVPDEAQPPTMRMEHGTGLQLVAYR